MSERRRKYVPAGVRTTQCRDSNHGITRGFYHPVLQQTRMACLVRRQSGPCGAALLWQSCVARRSAACARRSCVCAWHGIVPRRPGTFRASNAEGRVAAVLGCRHLRWPSREAVVGRGWLARGATRRAGLGAVAAGATSAESRRAIPWPVPTSRHTETHRSRSMDSTSPTRGNRAMGHPQGCLATRPSCYDPLAV